MKPSTHPRKSKKSRGSRRAGNIVVLSAVLMVVLCACIAMAVDLGLLHLARTELQRTADASALAAAWELIDESSLRGDESMTEAIEKSREAAVFYGGQNTVCGTSLVVDANPANNLPGDVVIGYLPDFSAPGGILDVTQESRFNAVHVRTQRSTVRNGEVPLFFARIWGRKRALVRAHAVAAVTKDIEGIEAPPTDHNVPLLPFALDEQTWNLWLAGETEDKWTWIANPGAIEAGADGVRELNLYPQDTGAAANRGTVNIGTDWNSTSFVARQILSGVTAEDLEYHGGELRFDEKGELLLTGNPGISAGFKDELTQIRGQGRIIPIFREVTGTGNNAEYTITAFVGVRVMEVVLQGSDKRVIVQPATVVTHGTIPGTNGASRFVYSPARLVR